MPTSHFDRAALPPAESYYRQELGELCRPDRHRWARPKAGCPFHNSKSKTSFHVNVETGGFNCFACGAKGGDVLAFERMRYKLGFEEAAKKLNAWNSSPSSAIPTPKKERPKSIERRLAEAVIDGPPANPGRVYRLAVREELHQARRIYYEISARLSADQENEEFWEHLQAAYAEVETWEALYIAACEVDA